MKYVDFDGNAHVMNESHSIAILSDDSRCQWGFNKNGSASISVDGQEIVEAKVEIELSEGRWETVPFMPVPIEKILYRKTYAVKEWLAHTRLPRSFDEVITDKAYKWEIGMNLKTRTQMSKVLFQSRIMVPETGETVFEVYSNLPVRVHIKTSTFDRVFERNGPQLLKFSAGIF